MLLSQDMHNHLVAILDNPVVSNRDMKWYITKCLQEATLKSTKADDNHILLSGKFRSFNYVWGITTRGNQKKDFSWFGLHEFELVGEDTVVSDIISNGSE